jgi:four helix bundle protein
MIRVAGFWSRYSSHPGTTSPVQPYERFRAWHACDALVVAVYRASERFPRSELYGLTSQARRAAFSAAVNIAEGSAKHGRREFRRYLDISIGSLSELSYTLQLCRKLEFLSEEQWVELDRLRDQASRLTWSLYKAVRGERAPTA